MPREISCEDMMALADLIREIGHEAVSVEAVMGSFDFSYLIKIKTSIEVLVGIDGECFIATGKIHGLPMKPYAKTLIHGEPLYYFEI